jgi:hypothetical protein
MVHANQLSRSLADILRSHMYAWREDGITGAGTRAATTIASFWDTNPQSMNTGPGLSNWFGEQAICQIGGLKTVGLGSTLDLDARKFLPVLGKTCLDQTSTVKSWRNRFGNRPSGKLH